MNPLRWLAKQLIGPDDDAPPDPERLVTIAEGPDGVTGLWQSTLESEGIPSALKRTSIVMYAPPNYELQVRYKDFVRARAILGLDDAPGAR